MTLNAVKMRWYIFELKLGNVSLDAVRAIDHSHIFTCSMTDADAGVVGKSLVQEQEK